MIAGLGNPGPKYAKSRHNIGFMIIDNLIRKHRFPDPKHLFDADISRGILCNQKVMLVKPMAYMNRSGLPVRKLLAIYGFKSEESIIIHDDMDLALGRIKIKAKGGHGGHKGIQSLMDAIGNSFIRLRIGIGRPHEGVDVIDHVLGNFKQNEMEAVPQIIDTAQEAVLTILCHGAKEGMNRFNSHKNQLLR